MSVKFVPVQWNPNKYVYDAVLLICVVVYVLVFLRIGVANSDVTRPVDGAIVRMRAFGSCAFLMLTVIMCIGPLARLNPRFLPLLYNRRHFGVLTAIVALTHVVYVLGWYYAFSDMTQIEALLAADRSSGTLLGYPFERFGVIALAILLILAATSHDFWLAFLSAPIWKALHLLIYPAYAAAVAHFALGYLQDADNPFFTIIAGGGALSVSGLHLAAALKARRERRSEVGGEWIAVSDHRDIADGTAVVIPIKGDERAAVFRLGNTLSAVSNACAHQNGPLGEGRIVDGCITCPWHGFQYNPQDGCAPAPFTEKIPTYDLKLEKGTVMIRTQAHPPGTAVAPLILPEADR
ncbi:MAG: ferric reductase-like transmembrane domain-containing protein [Azospirillaceae bacterium]